MDAEIKAAFDKIYGDMTLSESDVALSIFEYGYKAGADAEREACAKVCEQLHISNKKFEVSHDNCLEEYNDYLEGKYMAVLLCASAIRERTK